MTIDDDAGTRPEARRWLFVLTIFAGSFLLFLMQPMIARMALPRLGGAPAVWNSAMLVYQALLLGGYAYAHLVGRLSCRRQAGVHLALLAFSALWLPIGLSSATPSTTASPELWVPWLLAISIGPLFFAVSAQAPLMQRWFAAGQPDANPYLLYAASNLGSFGGLIAYPLIVEPLLATRLQSLLWSGGYILLVALVAVCAWRLPHVATRDAYSPAVRSPRPSVALWMRWIALAAVPSGLILSTTTHLTTDIIAMPLIWVIPLGLYLLSFVVAFAAHDRLARIVSVAFAPVLIAGAATMFLPSIDHPVASALFGLALLFVVAVTLHFELYQRRPAPEHLTAFYLAMSIGGVVGGLFCAIVAPTVFDWVYEHPLLIAAAAFLATRRPLTPLLASLWTDRNRSTRLTGVIGLLAVLLSLIAGQLLPVPAWLGVPAIALLVLLCVVSIGHRLLFGLCIMALGLASGGWNTIRISTELDARTRSYFGVYTVIDRGTRRELVHGTTLHGVQLSDPRYSHVPSSYYAPRSGVGTAMRMAPTLFGPHARVGVVGLGSGTLACYRQPGQDWRFYEIDPAIVAIARNPAKFTYLSRCAPDARILLGDARLVLDAQEHAPHDLLVIDAFSSDAVPMHLLTLEAFQVYRRALAPDGLLMVHISNRFMTLEPVLAAAARAGGWHASIREYHPTDAEADAGATRSIWVALSPSVSVIDRLTVQQATGLAEWDRVPSRPGFRPWTDDYASILPVLKRGN